MKKYQPFNLDWNKLNLSSCEKDALILCEKAYILRHLPMSKIDDRFIENCLDCADYRAVGDKFKKRFSDYCRYWIRKKAKKSVRKRFEKAIELNVSIRKIPENPGQTPPKPNSRRQRLKNRTPREKFIAEFKRDLGNEPMPGFNARRRAVYYNKLSKASKAGLINDNDYARLSVAIGNKMWRNDIIADRCRAESYHRIMTLIEHGYLPCFPGHENEFEHVKDEKKSVTKEWRRYQRDKKRGLVD